jgi:hypothetical protein
VIVKTVDLRLLIVVAADTGFVKVLGKVVPTAGAVRMYFSVVGLKPNMKIYVGPVTSRVCGRLQ